MKMLPWMYNLERIKATVPSMRYNGDRPFAEWQRDARKKLAELLGINNVNRTADKKLNIEYKKEEKGYTEYRFTLESEPGYRFPCVMRVPTGKSGKIPLLLCLQGHATGMHVSLGKPIYPGDEETISGGDRDFVVRGVKEGYASVAIEQRNFGEMGARESDGEPMCHVSSMSAIISGRTTIAERICDVSAVIDVIEESFDFIDANDVTLMGNSGGGTATYYAACMDERIKMAIPSCAVCTYKHSIAAMFHCTCNFIPNIANYFDMGDLGGLIAPRKLVVVNGKQDDIFPVEGVRESMDIISSLYSAAGVPDNCALVTGPEGHRFYADLSWPVVHKMRGE